jgi:hypothetical protein
VNPRLRELPNVVLLPHMGSATREGRAEMGEKVIINIKTFADGHRPPDMVVPGDALERAVHRATDPSGSRSSTRTKRYRLGSRNPSTTRP